ncbi:MAG: helix-turn-helix domain-containing protein [Dermabacter sp.]|nr:helix-turn-helix domain-containing protein [Dermabacter sp.]
MAARFLTIDDICDILAIEKTQAYALLRKGQLRGLKLGGRGEWRVEASELEAFIENSYRATEAGLKESATAQTQASSH